MIIKLIFIIAFIGAGSGLQLKQVVMLSRHNIRTPLTTNLQLLTPKRWPNWNGNTGYLTPKGQILEQAMGRYFADWIIEEKLLLDKCPRNQVFVFSNTRERTIQTAKSFAEGAFGDCVEVYYKNMTGMDPVFNPVVRNVSEEFKEIVLSEMQAQLNKIDLKNALLRLNTIVDIKDSEYCKTENICDLSEVRNKIVFELNKEPDVAGALQLGNTLVDAFLMAYYDGMKEDDVAWGQIHTLEDWKALLKILKTYHKIRFQTKLLDRDVASTLVKYLGDVFQNGSKKFYVLVGHDANILSLMSSLNFKDYTLDGQFEKTPIGGKVVFEKWHDEVNGRDLLRARYVYQSSTQIRDGVEASLLHPPLEALLEMEDCAVDENGYCAWDDFIRKFNIV
ncbi:LOW QUALITY PROTEIN: glucose-1-phosphatase-like [Cydia pomonella]|uniref:LOW QUALITY PROTEIN: glucose-1-phosphatase-like n=1 Tax=Cydia pomonella TaxID=82600 RepID=UPI002ADD9F43|nr:LOW QUALITY PROTEIN: glucose-1-phosphatase-like [Cydia pomonella]